MHDHRQINPQEKWDRWFLSKAEFNSQKSKDPSTRVGAVIVGRKNRVISDGYNGFARGVKDSAERLNDRETKLKYVVHAELNAIIFAQQDLKDCTLYTWPFQPCSRCASAIIQSGITRVVYPKPTEEQLSRWGEDFCLSKEIFHEGWVETVEYE